jgi:hypothetical protein
MSSYSLDRLNDELSCDVFYNHSSFSFFYRRISSDDEMSLLHIAFVVGYLESMPWFHASTVHFLKLVINTLPAISEFSHEVP